MNIKSLYILSLSIPLIFTLILSGCNQTPAQPEQPAQEKGTQLQPPPIPVREEPNLSFRLYELIEAKQQGKAAEYADQYSDIKLVDDTVLVGVEAEPGQVEAALNAVRKYGKVRDNPNKSGSFGAYVPIDSLIPLIKEDSVQSIELPTRPTVN